MGRTLAPYSSSDVVARGAQLAAALRAKGGTVISNSAGEGFAPSCWAESPPTSESNRPRAAHDRGYELIFAEDAMSSLSAEAHGFALENIFPRMGRVRRMEQVLTELA
jgi:hypothetical protein